MSKKPIEWQPPEAKKRSFFIAALDTETYGLDGRLTLAQAYHENWKEALVFRDANDMLEKIFSLPSDELRETIWYAHNAEYDWRYLIETIARKLRYNIRFKERAAGRFYELEIVKRDTGKRITRFRDSMAIFPFGLADFTKKFAPEYAKKDIGLGSGVNFDPDNPVHIEYAKFDVLGLVKAIQRFDELIFDNFGVHVKATSSGTAYHAWLRHMPRDAVFWRQCAKTEAFFRKCYHGGLVNCNAKFQKEYEKVRTLDINSSYPANMRQGVPLGRARSTSIYREGEPGFYHCVANVPDDAVLPIVPFRSEKGQLAWQTGTFETFLSSLEIEHCQELGVTFEVIKGYYFPEGLCFPFNDFIDICERLRTENKGQPLEDVVKLMQNSLYGRFGMKLEGRELVLDLDGQPDNMEAVFDPKTNNTIPDVYSGPNKRDTAYMLPHWAGWITANARVLLDAYTELAGREHVLYRDTDSLTGNIDIATLQEVIGKPYGFLKDEGFKTRYKVHGPKVYTYVDKDGNWQATAKGIPRSQLKLPVRGAVETEEQFKDRVLVRNELVQSIHNGTCKAVAFHSSTSLMTFTKTGIMYFNRKRLPTDAKNVYGHQIENGMFRPRKAKAGNGS